MGKYTTIRIDRITTRCPVAAWIWRPWKRFKWLGKFAEKIWLSLGETYSIEQTRPVVRRIEHNTIWDFILRQKDGMSLIWNERARHLVLGPQHLRELEDCIQAMATCKIVDTFHERIDGKWENRVLGMTVHIVPWCTEPILLPDWDDT